MKRKRENFFLLIFVLWFIVEFLSMTTIKQILFFPIGWLRRTGRYLVIGLLMLQMVFCQTYKRKEIVILIAISVPFLITAVMSGNSSLLFLWMFLVAAKDCDFDKLVHTIYKILFFLIPMVILLCLTGVIEDNTKIRDDEFRYSLGFMHPNQLGVRLLLFVICHFYVHKDKLKLIDYLIALAAALFIYIVPNSLSSCMCILIFVILLLVYRLCNHYNEKLVSLYGKILLFLAAVINAGSVLLSFIDVKQNKILWQINLWMSVRFSEGHKTLKVFGVPLWGQHIYLLEEERLKLGMTDGFGKLLLDNAYLLLLVQYGIIMYLLFSVAYLLLMNNCRYKKKYMMMIILFVFAVYGIMENGLIQAYHNIFLISLSSLLNEKLKESNNINDKTVKKESLCHK